MRPDAIDFLFENYRKDLAKALDSVDRIKLKEAYQILSGMRSWHQTSGRAHIFVCGNGGSAAIADHLTCDHGKGIWHDTGDVAPVHSLCSTTPLLTAIANDYDYTQVFSKQIDMLMDRRNENLLIAISSSGNSPNIVAAIEHALEKNSRVIALVGFDGGLIKQKFSPCATIIHVNSNNYGVVEDCHQSIMHILAQTIRSVNHSGIYPLKL